MHVPRTATVERSTSETRVAVRLDLDPGAGPGQAPGDYANTTGIGFLDHMLDLFAKHGGFGLHVECDGDLDVDAHHSVEDVGIALGQALWEALGDKAHITRYGSALVPMDETLARAVVDLSGRFYLVFDAAFDAPALGTMPTSLVKHFFYSFAEHAHMNLHLAVLYGEDDHHRAEALFKATARALRIAVRRDAANAAMPSTKGSL